MFYPSLDEKKKLEIARLYHTTDMPVDEIAKIVGVCPKTAYNHKNHGYEDTVSPVSSMPVDEKPSQSKKNQWECKNCGYIAYEKGTSCPRCGRGPFFSNFTKVGSPNHVPYVPPQREPEAIKTEGETVDYTIDHWICKECDYMSNTEFVICPKCSCDQVTFAPNGMEPRYPDNYIDSNEESTNIVEEEPPGKVDQEEVEPEEKSKEEFDWTCPHCGQEVNPVDISWFLSSAYCPHCNKSIEVSEE